MTREHSIVVVEDEPAVLDAVCQMLELRGHHTVCWSTGEDVLRAPSESRPSLFLLDLMLPRLDGIELAKRLRSRYGEETPVIAMSAHDRLLEEAAASGLFTDTVPKPFDLYAVMECVEHYLDEEGSVGCGSH